MFQTVSMSMEDVAVEVCVCVSCVLREIRQCGCMDLDLCPVFFRAKLLTPCALAVTCV